MPGTTKEVHLTVITTHNLVVDGEHLVEEKKTTSVTSKDTGKVLSEIRQHERRIGSQSIMMMITEDGRKKEETELSDEEKKQFNSDWQKLWKPAVGHAEIEKMLEKMD